MKKLAIILILAATPAFAADNWVVSFNDKCFVHFERGKEYMMLNVKKVKLLRNSDENSIFVDGIKINNITKEEIVKIFKLTRRCK